MEYAVTEESFASLMAYRQAPGANLKWSSVFVLPGWMEAWWQVFGAGADLYLRAVWCGEEIIGIMPLMLWDKTATIVGSADVCDYSDFIVAPGREEIFFGAMLDDMEQRGVERLELSSLRPDSAALTGLVEVARQRGYGVDCCPEAASLEMALPPTWEDYLAALTTKQRHEVRRKLRRLAAAGEVVYRCIEDRGEAQSEMGTFLKMFPESRTDKADFLTDKMVAFFRHLADAMAVVGLLRLGVLEMDGQPAAMIMAFDYNDCLYLYNSAYDPRYKSLSAGLVCKVLCLKEAIERGRKKWDFLKGKEAYKYHLGGQEVPLSGCRITVGRQADGG